MSRIKNFLLVASTGYIFVYFSEHLFWARIRPEDTRADWISTWIAYSFLAFIFLGVVSHFRIRNIWPLFLAGAAFGWMTEGLVVQTTYEDLPLSISFTGLAWHALITVWIGWYAIQRSLLATASFPTLKLAIGIGLCSGLWGISWWLEPDGGVSTLANFATFSLVTTMFVIAAYRLANWSSSEPFLPGRRVTIVVSGLFTLYFLFISVPVAPMAALILPALLGLIYIGLRHYRDNAGEDSFIDSFGGHVSTWKFMSILALPVTSTIIYGLALELNLRWHTNWILYLITTPLGFMLFGLSLYKSWRYKTAP